MSQQDLQARFDALWANSDWQGFTRLAEEQSKAQALTAQQREALEAARINSAPPTPVPAQQVAYKELATYRKSGTTWKNIVVEPRTEKERLVALAKELRRKDPSSAYRIFDDESRVKQFIDWDTNYPNPAYPLPEAWANTHHLANVQQMLQAGRMRWGLYTGFGEKLADLD